MFDFLADRSNRTVGRALCEGAARYGDSPYLRTMSGRTYTFSQVNSLANALTNYLRSRHISERDHVAFMLPNGAAPIIAVFGILKGGMVCVPIDYRLMGEGLRYVLRHSDAKALVTDVGGAARARDMAGERLLICELSEDLIIDQQPLEAQPSREPILEETTWKDLAAIAYTGGTTGRSKGVMISHNYALAEGGYGRDVSHRLSVSGDVFLCVLPLHHGIFWVAALGPWLVGAQVVVADRFSVTRFWDQVRTYGVSQTMLVGSMIPYLYKQEPREDDARHPLRQIWGNPMPREIHRDFERRFGVELIDDYAMTEASVMTSNWPGDTQIGSCGKVLRESFDVKIFDENDAECEPGVVGEFVARPVQPHIMMEGYYKDPEATVKATRNLWFHTGDLGYMDSAGYFYFIGRSKDAIRRHGEMVSALDIETVLAKAIPEAVDLAVVPVETQFGDEEIKVVLELRPGRAISPAAVRKIAERELPKFMRPRYVRFVSQLPRTELGRIQKATLRGRHDDDIDLGA